MSTELGVDERSAYHRFRLKAQQLDTVSTSLNSIRLNVTAAYYAALTTAAPDAWTTLVAHTALLVQRAHELAGFVPLSAEEREALRFFESIVNENADLLGEREAIAPASVWNHGGTPTLTLF